MNSIGERKVFFLRVLNVDASMIRYVSKKLRDDENVIFECAQFYLDYIKYASKRLRNDGDFILECVGWSRQAGYVLPYLSKRLINDKDFMINIIMKNQTILFDKKLKVRNNKEFILAFTKAVYIHERFLNFISEELRDDEDVFLAAMEKNRLTFEFASERLLNNREFILNAIKKDHNVITFVTERLKNNKDFILDAIKIKPSVNLRVLWKIKKIILEVLKLCNHVDCVPYYFKNDKEVVQMCMGKNIRFYEDASENLKQNKDLVMLAIKRGIKFDQIPK